MSINNKVIWDAISAYIENAEDMEGQWTQEASDGDEAAERRLAELAEARRIQATLDVQFAVAA